MPAPTSNTKTSAIAAASFSASRITRRKIIRKIPPTITRRKTIATEVNADPFITAHCPLPTAHCLPLLVFRLHGRLDISAHIEVAFYFYVQRIAGVHEIFQDHVDDMLVKDLHVTKRVDVELQTL